jgi:cytochrome c biogenesis protein CcmG, thiol:disulfide interchange protein DsbE
MKKTAMALAIALALFGCTSRQPVSTSEKSATPKGPAPDFDLENVAGGKIKAAELKGKVSVIDFWATWCEPCIAEIPKFNQLHEQYPNIQVIGITVMSPHDDIKPKVAETGMKYTVLVGNDDVMDGFGGLVGFPTTFIVTKDWKIYKKYLGALPNKQDRIKKDIEKLLATEETAG